MSNFRNRDGSTPLDLDQMEGIKYPHITIMAELDELEDENIQRGLDWLNRYKKEDYLSIEFLKKLHKKLFGDVWLWAGKLRTKEVNLSNTRPYDVGPGLKMLFEDIKVWIKAKNIDWNEIAAEFHHRLVRIHPFPNGNGRTTRIFIEFFQKRNGQDITSWMASLKNSPKERRQKYIQSLRKADKGDYSELIEFVKEKRKS